MVDLSFRPALLAAELTARGAAVVVVGGTARWLRHGTGSPADLDLVVTPGQLPALAGALTGLGVPARAAALGRVPGPVRLSTGWGPVDVFVCDRAPAAAPVLVGAVRVPVQASA